MKISISRKFYSGTLHFIQIFWIFPFLGIFTSETRCLNCETVTSKDEDFFDLSIDVEQNTSITSCLKNFSNTETLCSDNKFQCDSCCTLQEAHVSIFFKSNWKSPNFELWNMEFWSSIQNFSFYVCPNFEPSSAESKQNEIRTLKFPPNPNFEYGRIFDKTIFEPRIFL